MRVLDGPFRLRPSLTGCIETVMRHIISLSIILLLLAFLVRGAIISQSSIQDCTWGDSSEPTSPGGTVCNKKMLISMVLGSGQGNTESLHANVDKAHEEGKEEMSVLKKPFRIELRKTAVVASYRAYLLGSANALPKETTIAKQGCVDDFFAKPKKLPCGIQYHGKTNKRVWDSQGFCCRCFVGFQSQKNRRGGHSCDLGSVLQMRTSAHCMKMDDLWYDVFSVEMPMMQYKITVDVLELQGVTVNNATGSRHVDWKLISTFHLSPSRTISRSSDGRVIAELQGSLLGSQAVKDLSHKKLLIPSVRMWPKNKPYPPAYTNGPNDWMLVDTNMVRLHGMECNKIGVGYSGFRRQPGRCNIDQGSCFRNQPLQLWSFDNEKRKKKQSGRYMIHNFGKVHHGSHPNNHSFILKFYHEDLHNSFVTLRIDASDISFVRSISSGRIVETYTVPFTAAVGHGSLTVEIGNTGEVLSEYSVSVAKCSSGLHDIAAKTLSLNPGEVKNTSFTLRSGDVDGGSKKCEVQLYDSNFNLLDVAKIDIKVGAACLCFGICGCVCEDEGNKSPAHCPQPGPPTIYVPGPIALILFFMVLESIGAHGFIAFFGGILLILGFIKLSCGGIICCRKTKQQEYTQKMIDKGVPPKSPLLVQCSGECRGAKAARARYERKVKRLTAAGKSPHRLDDWRNTSFECHCKTELTDIRMIHIVRTVCFFYFCCILPFIWLGRCIVWRVLRDTGENMAKAEQQVLMRAKKKGKLEKYGIVDLATELKKFEEENEKVEREKAEQRAMVEALAMNIPSTPTTESGGNKDSEERDEVKKEKAKEKRKLTKATPQEQGLQGNQEKTQNQSKDKPSDKLEDRTEEEAQEQRACPNEQQTAQKDLAVEEITGKKEEEVEGESVVNTGQREQENDCRPNNKTERKQRTSSKPPQGILTVEGTELKTEAKESKRKSPKRPKRGKEDQKVAEAESDRRRTTEREEKRRRRDKSKDRKKPKAKETEQGKGEESLEKEPETGGHSGDKKRDKEDSNNEDGE